MAKSKEKNQALKLRHKGESIKDISKKLGVSKSTASLWCRDVKLTPKQVQRLHKKMLRGSYRGRLKGARIQYERRLKRNKELKREGFNKIGKCSDRDLLVAGAAVYWGEGSKSERKVRIGNSDPKMIKFMLKWFTRVWNIKRNRFTLHVGINEIHKDRVEEVEEYWSKVAKIPRKQFIKTTLIKAKNKKAYDNFPVHYGVLTIRVKRPVELHYQIMGLIEGLTRI